MVNKDGLQISGDAEVGATVALVDADGNQIDTVKVGADGKFVFDTPNYASFNIVAVDEAGNKAQHPVNVSTVGNIYNTWRGTLGTSAFADEINTAASELDDIVLVGYTGGRENGDIGTAVSNIHVNLGEGNDQLIAKGALQYRGNSVEMGDGDDYSAQLMFLLLLLWLKMVLI